MKLKNLFAPDSGQTKTSFDPLATEGCCGQHQFCRKNILNQPVQKPIEYYDDEELDIFKNRSSASYSYEEIELFADILHTMKETDVPGWIDSLQFRNIELPDVLKTEIAFVLGH
jgi:hypothetical protein